MGDRAVGISVVMAEHYGSALLSGELGQGGREVAVVVMVPVDWESEATDYFVDLANAPRALVGHCNIDRDTVNPCLGWCDRLPGGPLLESPLERVLGAIFRRRPIAKHDNERSQDFAVGRVVEALKIGLVARHVTKPSQLRADAAVPAE